MTQAEIEKTLLKFEGLVYETAKRIVAGGVELELEDVAQLLRVKVWQSVQRFDECRIGTGSRIARGTSNRTPLERFVFGCVFNLRLDIEKRPRRYNDSIDALRGDHVGVSERQSWGRQQRADRFDARYLSVTDEEVYELEELELPSDLTETERRVIALKLEGMHLFQIDRELGLSRAQRERVMESVRRKLAHLDPARGQGNGELHTLARDEPRTTRAHASLAA